MIPATMADSFAAPTHAPSVSEHVPMGYRAVSALSRFLLGVFYGRIDVLGVERLPPHAPLVVAANHHNSLVDAMLLVAFLPRRLRTLANAPLFKNPLIGPFLRMMGGLPVHRRQEAGNDPARNESLFAATTQTLKAGGAIMLFPEGRTQPEPVLLELRTGAARMLLAAEAEGTLRTAVSLVPVGLVFDSPGTFREGRALVLVGPPVETADAVKLARTEPEPAARLLTDRLGDSIRSLIVEAEDRETLQLLSTAEELWAQATGERRMSGRDRVAWLQRVMRTYRTLQATHPERLSRLRADLSQWSREVVEEGIDVGHLARFASSGVADSSAPREGLTLLLTMPLALLGILIHVIPYKLTGVLVRAMHRTDEEIATDKIALGFLLFPLAWFLETAAVYKLGGALAGSLFLIALLPLGFVAIWWLERQERATREFRAWKRLRQDPGLASRLRERGQSLADELGLLARLVPVEWPEGESDGALKESAR